MTKLFSNRDTHRFNISKLLSKLKAGGYYASLQVNDNVIRSWESLLSEKAAVIDNIVLLGDKIYAHTDPRKEEYRTIELYFKEVQDLIKVAEEIIVGLHSKVLGADLIVRPPTFHRESFDLVEILTHV